MSARVVIERVDPGPVCASFAWVGGPFHRCDRCGQPFWDHTHRDGQPSTPFGPDDSTPVPISAEEAAAVKARWGRGYRAQSCGTDYRGDPLPDYDVLLQYGDLPPALPQNPEAR